MGLECWSVVADRNTCNKHWTSSLPSRLTFSWMQGLLIKGWQKPLEISDMGQPPSIDKCGPISERFEEIWLQEVKKPKPSLILVSALSEALHVSFILADS